MEPNRKIAIAVGMLYIVGTVAGVLSVITTNSILGASDYLAEISQHENQMALGALFVLIMGLALAAIPAVAYPVLKKHNEVLAVGYVIFRGGLETLTYVAVVLSWLVLIPVSNEVVKASDAATYQAMGKMLTETGDICATMTAIIFPIGALMLYVVFYQSRLTPRWVSVWGLLAVALYIPAALLDLFDVISPDSSTFTLMVMPMILQEMVMAIWLIVKGFNPVISEPATMNAREMLTSTVRS